LLDETLGNDASLNGRKLFDKAIEAAVVESDLEAFYKLGTKYLGPIPRWFLAGIVWR
jgi:hypothetical protein